MKEDKKINNTKEVKLYIKIMTTYGMKKEEEKFVGFLTPKYQKYNILYLRCVMFMNSKILKIQHRRHIG